MLFILSPAKKLNLEVKKTINLEFFQPELLQHSQELVINLQKLSILELAKLMRVSNKLAKLNFSYYNNFHTPFSLSNASLAIFTFDGDVYKNIDITNFLQKDLIFAQKNMRILSGLYGILRPLDLIQPYRLEMGTKLKNKQGDNLYKFWNNLITDYLNNELRLQNSKQIINLASLEYSKVVNQNCLQGSLVNIIFKNRKFNEYKTIGILAKKARGMMANFIIINQISNIEELKTFNQNGYRFRAELSNQNNLHFYSDN